MKPILVSGPSISPVTLAELKGAARVDFNDDDTILQSYLDAAVGYLDGWNGVLGRALINQEWRVSQSVWPAHDWGLPFGDVSAATVKYLDIADTDQTLPDSAFEIVETATGALLRFKSSFDRPALTRDRSDAVQVTFTTGFGDSPDDVPPSLKVAIMLLACHWYENREAASGVDVRQLPLAVDALITPYRRVLF